MSEMVEPVAKALAKENRASDWDCIDEHDVHDRGYLLRRDYLSLARAAIEAMRSPTEAMVDAGYDTNNGEDRNLGDEGARDCWSRMIGAALCGAGEPRP